MAAAQRSAHSLLLLRIIRSAGDVQLSQLRTICQLLPSCTDHGYPHHQQSRYYSALSNGQVYLPFDVRHQQPNPSSSGINHDAYRRAQPHSTFGQAGVQLHVHSSRPCQPAACMTQEGKPIMSETLVTCSWLCCKRCMPKIPDKRQRGQTRPAKDRRPGTFH